MASIKEHTSADVTKLLLVGDSGSGKTAAQASLANAGRNVRILDYDDGLSILPDLLTPEGVSRVSYVTLKDPIGKAEAFRKGANLIANWKDGELLEGPKDHRHFVECSFMWPEDMMPDPAGGKRLLDRGCKVTYQKDELFKPRQIKGPEDYRPGTTKGKIDAHEIWVVTIKMPKQLIGNFKHGTDEIDSIDEKNSESMSMDQTDAI